MAEGKSNYPIYHDSYTKAMATALDFARRNGYTVTDTEIENEITFGQGKPSVGKTTKHSLQLMKGDKEQKKRLQVQVYGLDTKFELNMYIN